MVPHHIVHQYTQEMSQKSEVFPLPIQFKDDKKYTDVVDILANLEAIFEYTFKADNPQEGTERDCCIDFFFGPVARDMAI